jgi:hypothetical protein
VRDQGSKKQTRIDELTKIIPCMVYDEARAGSGTWGKGDKWMGSDLDLKLAYFCLLACLLDYLLACLGLVRLGLANNTP